MKTGLTSNLTRAFLMRMDLAFSPKSPPAGKLWFGLLGKNDFLVPVEVPLPRELALAANLFVEEAEKWIATQEILFSEQSGTNPVVNTFSDDAPATLVTEED